MFQALPLVVPISDTSAPLADPEAAVHAIFGELLPPVAPSGTNLNVTVVPALTLYGLPTLKKALSMLTATADPVVARDEPTCVQLLVPVLSTVWAQSCTDVDHPVPLGLTVPPVICVIEAVVRAPVVNVHSKSLFVIEAGLTVLEFKRFAHRQDVDELFCVRPGAVIADTVRPLRAEP